MEVLRSEFEEKLPIIKKALLEADFISIDTEFTGLTPPNVQFNNMDDMSTRYSKIKSCVEEFTIIQYGVCAFKRNPENGDYVATPFNFYIFGADTDSVQSRRVFSATPSSLTFLRTNKFDFNKLIEEGIPFYNHTEENSMFQGTNGTNMMNRRNLIKESQLTKSGKGFLEYNRNSIKKWLQGNTEKPLSIQVNTAFYKRLIYQEIQDDKYNGFLQATQKDSNHLEITRLKEEDKKKKSVKAPKVNFRTIVEYIQKAKCPVVAHNAAFDIFHTVDQFWQYLPNEVADFKNTVNSMWPNIVDTKYLAEYHPTLKNCFNTSVLGSLYNTVYEELKEAGQKIVMAEGFDRYGEGGEVEHEAGYDSYMTGVIYLAFIAFIHEKQNDGKAKLGKRKREDNEADEPNKERKTENGTASDSEEDGQVDSASDSSSDSASDSDETDSEDDKVPDKSSTIFMDKSITPYYGRIFLMRSDIPYINLKGEETVEVHTFPNKFYLHNIPTGMTNTGIEKLFPTILPIAVSWVNDNNAWIILKDESKIPFVKQGTIGFSLVQSFLPGFSRAVEGVAYGITKEAGQMELLSHEKWQQVYGPNKTVNYNNAASIMNNEKKTTTEEDSVPSGGAGYDDLDIPLPPSFRASLKKSSS